jgi:hypothetical protein
LKKIVFGVAFLLIVIFLSGCGGGKEKKDEVIEQIFFAGGEWRTGYEWDSTYTTKTGRLKYAWTFQFYSTIPCTLRVRHEYYNYDSPDTPEETLYTEPVNMEGKVMHVSSGEYFTTNNIKKIRVILERIDKGTVEEKSFTEYDNITKLNP